MCEGDVFFFQAEDGIRDAQESRGLGDVYKRQSWNHQTHAGNFQKDKRREKQENCSVYCKHRWCNCMNVSFCKDRSNAVQ